MFGGFVSGCYWLLLVRCRSVIFPRCYHVNIRSSSVFPPPSESLKLRLFDDSPRRPSSAHSYAPLLLPSFFMPSFMPSFTNPPQNIMPSPNVQRPTMV
ncbi:hypothetical protein K438DRAFT_1020724 [Mycena galopus ATCC 62051]|nr:hypothetical protein K438DRAFT_1020724 [Mycena galopus ATCC 62051]